MPSSKQSTLIPKGLVWAFIIIGFLGFLDATFLTAEHYLGSLLNCPLFGGCEKVTTSPYAVIGGIPVALIGAIYYLAIFILGIVYFDTKHARILRFAANLTPLGLIASLWFLHLQIFVIKALCFYCLVSLMTSTLLFIFGLFFLRKFRNSPV
jgi:uncharacterized membrane protein